MPDTFAARSILTVHDTAYEIVSLPALAQRGFELDRLPYSLKILLENLLRHEDGVTVTREDIAELAEWKPGESARPEISFSPARVLLQDFTGVPALVDLAAMRDAMAELGGEPGRINPLQPVELVIDHSIQVDAYGSPGAVTVNAEMDYRRNRERYAFLRWGQRAFADVEVVPPHTGIVHQVNLEYLARVVFRSDEVDLRAPEAPLQAYPDTLVGTDSHTTMINGLGVLGWGVGGIEAEAAMLGQPISMLTPEVIGFRLVGALREGATATDLVLTVTELLRRRGVVGRFVEFFGPGLASLRLADRATIGNMCPEYGATCAMFPVDQTTLDYLRLTGRKEAQISLVESYMRHQGLFHTPESPEPRFTDLLELDLASVEPSIAGPRRPQDRIPLSRSGEAFRASLVSLLPQDRGPMTKDTAHPAPPGERMAAVWGEGSNESPSGKRGAVPTSEIRHGSVVIAAITSCTNTSNPSVMLAAGLLAQKAVEKGLRRSGCVKTSLAPGSQAVTDYLTRAGLTPFLDELGFHLVGYGCTTCIGNSGPLPPEIAEQVEERGLVVCAVLSGNRNFEGRINSSVRASYLMSPPLVIAFALAGRIDIDLAAEPLGRDAAGNPVFLRDIWPSQQEIETLVGSVVSNEIFQATYQHVFRGDERWNALVVPQGDRFAWETDSRYVRRPPYFDGMARHAPEKVEEIANARVLAWLGDSVTTDHISPAGNIKADSPAGRYLIEHGIPPDEFNSYGSRRGNHEVMVRGTFANSRIRNRLAPDTEGGFTRFLPSGEVTTIFEAAERYKSLGVPLLILAGKEYGSGSSRDWAAKGPFLLGVRLVIAQSYERIHRSNLVGMGILPLQFQPEESAESLGLTGEETFCVSGLARAVATGFAGGRDVTVEAQRPSGETITLRATVRIDTPQELLYYRHGGILQYVLRQLLSGREKPEALPGGLAAGHVTRPGAVPSPEAVDESALESFPASDPPSY